VLLGVPWGIGIACCGGAFFLDGPLAAVLLVLGLVLGVLSWLMIVVTLFIGDRWYPRWYHDEPGHRW